MTDINTTTFVPVPRNQLPRDDAAQTGKDLRFRTLEHNEFDAPHAIEVTDREGRSAVYVLLEVDGVVGRWKSS
jgi:hypothetical protein